MEEILEKTKDHWNEENTKKYEDAMQLLTSKIKEFDASYDEVIAYVQNYPGAIGYVSKGKAVAAKGVSLVETDEKIARPFYLVHMGEKNDLERDFMRMTMEEIGKIYDGTYTAWSNLKEEK